MTTEENSFTLFYVRIMHDTRTFGYIVRHPFGRQAVTVSLLERKRMLRNDWGIAVWKIDGMMLEQPKHTVYRLMELKDKADADVFHILDTRGEV